MSLRTIVGIYPFGPTGTQRVLLFLGSFCKLSQSTALSDFRYSYQNFIRIIIWLFFLVVYSQAGTISFLVLADHLKLSGQSVNLLTDWTLCSVTLIFGRSLYILWL
jgi:hypothetical protein